MRESDRLSRLLSEFLDFARVRVARVEPLDLGHLARAGGCGSPRPTRTVLTGVRARLRSPRPASTSSRATRICCTARCFNLLLNAVQASPEGGEVRLDVAAASAEQLGGTRYDVWRRSR